MRAESLTRKTHFRRHHSLPVPAARIFDMTAAGGTADGGVTGLWPLDVLTGAAGGDAADDYAVAYYAGAADEDGAACGAPCETEELLGWCAVLIAESPVARLLWKHAAAAGWSVGTADLAGGGFYMDVAARCLSLDHFGMTAEAVGRSPYFRNAFLTTFIRALRDIWHEENFGAFEEKYGPEDVLMLERVRAADCDTVTLLAGWELRGAGFPEVWRHLLGTAEGDMALVFTRFLERDPSALFDGAALAYAFRQWYADEARVNGCDHQTLEGLDDTLATAAVHNPFGDTPLDGAMVEALSVLPDGMCYLAGLGLPILSDPFFAGLNDPINQTHMFHLMYDLEVTVVNHVPFRDARLARMIFPPV